MADSKKGGCKFSITPSVDKRVAKASRKRASMEARQPLSETGNQQVSKTPNLKTKKFKKRINQPIGHARVLAKVTRPVSCGDSIIV